LTATLRFQVLGRVRAWCGTEEIDVGPRKQRAVLAALLLHAGQPLSCPEIMEFVWPDTESTTVPNALYTYVHRLREALDPQRDAWARGGVVTSVFGGYVLRIEPEQVDVHRFRQLVARARQHRHAGLTDEARDLLAQAIRLWTGPPVADLSTRTRAHKSVTAVQRDLLAGAILAADTELAAAPGPYALARVAAIAARAPECEPLQVLLAQAHRRSADGFVR
jgi:DNA-binding SARP family transcriptional activator